MKQQHIPQREGRVSRRGFIASAGAAAVAASTITSIGKAAETPKKFKLKYAPHLDMFYHNAGSKTRGGRKSIEDAIAELQFASDQSFTAWEDNNMMSRSVEFQEKFAREMNRLGMTMGVFVSFSGFGKDDMMTRTDKEYKNYLRAEMKKAVEVAKRVNAKWSTVVPGNITQKLEFDYQMANCIENLKVMANVCEPSGLVMVLESLNWWANHPGLFLTKIPQAYQICRAVGSPSCKILDDLYHQQVSEGNLIPNMDMAWEEIAYFQMGDNPGRNEPTTGEINYKNIFKHIYEKGFKGVLGMEHGNSKPGKEGEMAVIEAYRVCDDF
jgi:hydroxypyruvate isomerase